MAGTGATGLMALFLGDLANIFFLSLLRDEAVVAAVGYGSSIVLVTVSIGIGLAIAATSLVSPALGAGRRVRARRLAVNAHLWTFTISSVLAVVIWLSIPQLLDLLGATGRTHQLAANYLTILVPVLPPLALGMTSSAVLRSVGDPRRAMNILLAGAACNTILDPIFIFGLDMGIEGAAAATAVSRFAVLAMGLYGVVKIHRLMGRPRLRPFLADGRPLASIAVPAIATNVATPAANAYVTAAISGYGDSAVAGWAIIGRIIPVAFGAIYALSGSVGPIIGQNFGAGQFERTRKTLTLSLFVSTGFTMIAWIVLILASPFIVWAFRASGEAAELITLFCHWLAPLFAFLGAMYVGNAAFNTLGRPQLSALLNWARATLGTIPFVLAGGALAGAHGVVAGNMLGAIVFGVVSVILCYALIDRLAEEHASLPAARSKRVGQANKENV